MGALGLSSPEPITWDNSGGYDGGIIPEQTPDPITVALRDTLNAQVPYTPTMLPPTFPVYVRAQDNGPGDRIYSPDGLASQPLDYQFTSRYGASNYDPMVQPTIVRFESPEVSYNLLAYHELIAESTLSINQGTPGGQLTQSLRAPGINEGM
jgi:hypothetical protein